MSDQSFVQPDETRWQAFLRNSLDNMGQIARTVPQTALPLAALGLDKSAASWLNEKPVPKVAVGAAADPLAFGDTRNMGLTPTPVAAGVKPAAHEIPDVTGFLAGQLGEPVTITSGYRDPSHNAQVPGASKTSAHMQTFPDGSPMAYDFKPSASTTKDAAIKLAQNLSGQFDQIIDEGDHVHVSFDPRGRGQVLQGNGKKGYQSLLPSAGGGLQTITPTTAVGDTTHFPGLATLDPAQVGAMVPNARMLPTNVKLPPAPQQDMPADLTSLVGLDKASLLAPLAEAMKVKPRDGSHDTWDRFSSLLSGAASGAIEAGRAPTVGQLLLNAGAGAARGFKAEKMLQKGEQDKYDEMVRQANIALAQQGFNIDLKNVDVTNLNIGRADLSKENKRTVKYDNAKDLFNAQLQALNLNQINLRENVGAGNARDMARANAVIGATQSQASTTNEANLGQTKLNLETGGVAGIEKQVAKKLTEVGVDPLDEKSPHAAPARQVAMGVLTGNLDPALQGFAQDLVLNGGAAEILAPAKGDSPAAAKAKATAMRAIKTAKKPGDAQAAVQTLSQLFTSDHSTALKAAHVFAARGYPSAKLIIGANKGVGLSPAELKALGLN